MNFVPNPLLGADGQTYPPAAQVAAIAAWHRFLAGHGIGEGTPVGLLLTPSPQHLWILRALAELGAIALPINLRWSPTEVQRWLDCTQATHLLWETATAEIAQALTGNVHSLRLAEPPPAGTMALKDIPFDRQLYVLPTSGSTGTPKAIPLTLGHFWQSTEAAATRLPPQPGDRALLTLPLYHVGGLALMWRCLFQQTPLVVLPRFEVETVHRAIAGGITHLSLVPTALQRLLAVPNFDRWYPHWQRLRAVLLGGGPIPLPLVAQCQTLGIPIAPTYGLTEAASQVATLPPSQVPHKPQSVGQPLPGLTLTIRNDRGEPLPPSTIGEIWLQGARLSPACPQPYPTGDLGYLDAEGYLYIVNRRADLIVSGGENIYPREIEQILEPHCQAVCVVPRPDPHWGQVPVAVIVPGDRPLALSTVQTLCQAAGLARYKLPKAVVAIATLPLLANGKIDRPTVRAWVAQSPSWADPLPPWERAQG
ncbi:MAG: class I adenylate-forming enzyme family protein [Pseudanabaenaceae cyanobacterium]